MAHVVVVAALERLQHLPQDGGRLCVVHALRTVTQGSVDTVEEVRALAELEDQVDISPLVEIPHQLDDVRVVQIHERMYLTHQQRQLVVATVAPLDHLLDSAAVAKSLVPCAVHGAEGAAPQLFLDVIIILQATLAHAGVDEVQILDQSVLLLPFSSLGPPSSIHRRPIIGLAVGALPGTAVLRGHGCSHSQRTCRGSGA
mmetsp:Transcript_110767/g.352902  ORF Transcript_110767/g.352902 Transcript_110767/m.352902 type:complete len:200 (+) Transcript_110767:596-1195(+)